MSLFHAPDPPRFIRRPVTERTVGHSVVRSFLVEGFNDQGLIPSFGEEWRSFPDLPARDLAVAGAELFDLLEGEDLPPSTSMLDIGCGNGRWSRYLSPRLGHIDAIDPSDSVITAAGIPHFGAHIRWSQARAEDLPFPDDTFDLVICIGVLHHVSDPALALREAFRVLRPGGRFYTYIYYALEHRGRLYKALFALSDRLRRLVCRLPGRMKRATCAAIAVCAYLPLVALARLAKALGLAGWQRLPLAYYHNKSFHVMRNDALDRFGTAVETRFTREGTHALLADAGLGDVRFSDQPPYWHCIACKPH